jgi:hypothetical protein
MTREIEQTIDDLIAAAREQAWTERRQRFEAGEAQRCVLNQRLNDHRARLLALLAPEPEPSDAEIEAGAKALLLNWQGAETDALLNDPEWRDTYLQGARQVLAAARAARQTGGE